MDIEIKNDEVIKEVKTINLMVVNIFVAAFIAISGFTLGMAYHEMLDQEKGVHAFILDIDKNGIPECVCTKDIKVLYQNKGACIVKP